MQTTPSQLLTVRQVADRFGIGVRTVWKWAATGQLPPPIRMSGGRFTRWRAGDIERFIEEFPVKR